MYMRLGLCLTAGLLAVSCGPVQSTTVIWEASTAIEGARAADAQKYSPYEIVSAELYLEKALEEQSYANFEPAIVFGAKAAELAKKAQQKSDQATAAPPVAPVPGLTPQLPEPEPDEPSNAPVKIVPVPPASEETPPSVVVPVQE